MIYNNILPREHKSGTHTQRLKKVAINFDGVVRNREQDFSRADLSTQTEIERVIIQHSRKS